jgi:hypothetical protein
MRHCPRLREKQRLKSKHPSKGPRVPSHFCDRPTVGSPSSHSDSCLLADLATTGHGSFWHDQLTRIRWVMQIGRRLATIVLTGADRREALEPQLRGFAFSGSYNGL